MHSVLHVVTQGDSLDDTEGTLFKTVATTSKKQHEWSITRAQKLLIMYINKNVNVNLFKALNLRKFFTDCFEILIQRCIRLRAFLYIYII
jgi:hypothetical protein